MDEKIFNLLKNIFSESRNLNINYFENTQADLSAIDCGIRAQMEQPVHHYEKIRRTADSLKWGEIWKLRDTFMLSYVLFRASPDKNDFFSIGPFRTLPLEDKDYQHIQVKNNLSYTAQEQLRILLSSVPCNILHIEATAIARHILMYTHGLAEPVLHEKKMEFLEGDYKAPVVFSEDINEQAKKIADIYLHETRLMTFIAAGNYSKALNEAYFFLHQNMKRRSSDRMLSHRSFVYTSNTLFRKAAQTAGIPPIYLDSISQKFAQEVSACITHDQLNSVYLNMLGEYCRLCREYNLKNYSPVIQKVINYIRLNLNKELSPGIIADAVNFSAVYIARRFKEELNATPMSYIAQERIRVAKQMLRETSMTIQEVSNYVGIQDWNYFTKIFKKYTGTTPTEFRKKQNGAD